jgi:hypothetical protein
MEYNPATNLKIIVNRESVIHPSTFFVQHSGTRTEVRLITADELMKRVSEWMDPIFPYHLTMNRLRQYDTAWAFSRMFGQTVAVEVVGMKPHGEHCADKS